MATLIVLLVSYLSKKKQGMALYDNIDSVTGVIP